MMGTYEHLSLEERLYVHELGVSHDGYLRTPVPWGASARARTQGWRSARTPPRPAPGDNKHKNMAAVELQINIFLFSINSPNFQERVKRKEKLESLKEFYFDSLI